jgi:putative Mg2+ transporter-C (MgtC) family protein
MEIFLQLILAAFLGGLVGLEREYKKKGAGLRTYTLVSLGAAFFTIIAFEVFKSFPSQAFDPGRIIGQIVLGIGFIGGGLIIHKEMQIQGLTTAAGLWVVAGVGAAVGARIYWPAIFVALLSVLILAGLRKIEKRFFPE